MAAKRKSISKRVRFSVFARDGFTCVYCGRQPPAVVLNIEHVIPVCKGGTDGEDNLRTSCFDCNAGKGAKEIGGTVPTEADSFRQAQELAEQNRRAEQLIENVEAVKKRRQLITNLWCETLGCDHCKQASVTAIANLLDEFDGAQISDWLTIIGDKNWRSEGDAIRYLCGIARRVRQESNHA